MLGCILFQGGIVLSRCVYYEKYIREKVQAHLNQSIKEILSVLDCGINEAIQFWLLMSVQV